MAWSLSSAGLVAPASFSASGNVNTLDDYEEGGSGVQITCGTSGSVTASGNYWYVKVGVAVHFSFEHNTTGVSSPVGELRCAVPFTSAGQYSAGTLRCYLQGFDGSPFLQMGGPDTFVSYLANKTGAATNAIVASAGTRYFIGQMTYET